MSQASPSAQNRQTMIEIHENGLHVLLSINEGGDVRLQHFSSQPFESDRIPGGEAEEDFRLVEVHVSGENQIHHHGSKHVGTMPGHRLKYQTHRDYANQAGRRLEIAMKDPLTGLLVTSHMQFYNVIPVVRSWTELKNTGAETLGIEYVSSFALTGVDKEGLKPWNEKMELSVPHNTWYGEAQWKSYTLPQLGLFPVNSFSMKRISYSSTGTWSTSEHLPMGWLENRETGSGLIWQIEHNGSWHWEISDTSAGIDPSKPGFLYLQLSGPTENESHWWKQLAPGESFVSVPVAVGSVDGGFEKAVGALTRYRRQIRRENSDNAKLLVIFNDYMNCLMGDPTTEKLLPLVDAAAKAGCEYFCIDAGWYSDGPWWDGVGEWLPAKERFPGGIGEVLQYIRSKGLIPGLWLEIEVMGINCPKAAQVPDDWFFCRHGKRVIDHARYQLDFRNPAVVAHANEVIDRLVGEYGVGYIKMDYNINAGIGTEVGADSFGDGLLGHNQAYLAWLDSVFARYPELVIENCSSGGMRMDYALLSRQNIQSTSDQTDYRRNAVIAASAPTGVTPEQCAVWSYPLRNGDREEVVFNMINSLLLRIHQSGHLAEISPERFELVKEALDYYKTIREEIPESLPFWPLGLPDFTDSWLSLGLAVSGADDGQTERIRLAVWRLDSDQPTCLLPLPALKGHEAAVRLAYPLGGECSWKWNKDSGILSVSMPHKNSARLLEIEKQ